MEKTRVDWIDTAKFIGMLSVFIGHYINEDGTYMAGYLGTFVWRYNVPFLFFLSGCLENFRERKEISQRIMSDVKGIIVPYYVFGGVALLIAAIYGDFTHTTMMSLLRDLMLGTIRNTFFVTQLWFLTALFVMKLFFNITSFLHRKWLIVIVGVCLYGIGENYIYTGTPHLPYNIDSSIHYYVYYLSGYVIFPLLEEIFNGDYMILKIGCFLLSAIFSIGVYWGIFPIWNYADNRFIYLLLVLLLIIFECFIAYIIRKSKVLKTIGQRSLYLCGNEGLLNYIFPLVFGMFGMELVYKNPLSVVVMALIRIIIISFVIYPYEFKLVTAINYNLTNIFRRNEG